jgi:hypothetical protein
LSCGFPAQPDLPSLFARDICEDEGSEVFVGYVQILVASGKSRDGVGYVYADQGIDSLPQGLQEFFPVGKVAIDRHFRYAGFFGHPFKGDVLLPPVLLEDGKDRVRDAFACGIDLGRAQGRAIFCVGCLFWYLHVSNTNMKWREAVKCPGVRKMESMQPAIDLSWNVWFRATDAPSSITLRRVVDLFESDVGTESH